MREDGLFGWFFLFDGDGDLREERESDDEVGEFEEDGGVALRGGV
jgi:hypothetical protein